MKVLTDKRIVNAKYTRLTVVSQWPVLLHDWVAREAYCDNAADDFRMVGRLILATVMQLTVLFVSVTGLPMLATRFLGDVGFWAGMFVAAGASLSFQQSCDRGRPWGLFWLIERLEQPIRLRPVDPK